MLARVPFVFAASLAMGAVAVSGLGCSAIIGIKDLPTDDDGGAGSGASSGDGVGSGASSGGSGPSSGSAGSGSGVRPPPSSGSSSGASTDVMPFLGEWLPISDSDTLSNCDDPTYDGTTQGRPFNLVVTRGTTTDLSVAVGSSCVLEMNLDPTMAGVAVAPSGQTCSFPDGNDTQTVQESAVAFAVSGNAAAMELDGVVELDGPSGEIFRCNVVEMLGYQFN